MTKQNPFLREQFGRMVMDCDCASRIEIVKRSTDISWLQRVVEFPDMQGTVVKAAMVRIRKLRKAAA